MRKPIGKSLRRCVRTRLISFMINSIFRTLIVVLSDSRALGTAHICATACPFPPKGCCSKCAINNGYFNHYKWDEKTNKFKPKLIGITKEEFKQLKKQYKWTKGDGFWGNKGCKLPRESRSVICLNYYCNDKKIHLKLNETIDVYKTVQDY